MLYTTQVINTQTHSSPLMSFRTLILQHDDLPAFRAGFIVLSFLAAAMLPFGVFALLIVAHMAMDVVKYRELHGFTWRRTIRGTTRENVDDLSYLVFGLIVAILTRPQVYMANLAWFFQGKQVVVAAGVILLSKLIILTHFLTVLMHPVQHNKAVTYATRVRWRMSERMYASLFLLLLLFLLTVPHILALDEPEFHKILLQQMLPWKL